MFCGNEGAPTAATRTMCEAPCHEHASFALARPDDPGAGLIDREDIARVDALEEASSGTSSTHRMEPALLLKPWPAPYDQQEITWEVLETSSTPTYQPTCFF